jgi:nucleoside-diphosphate-sugar epimerase
MRDDAIAGKLVARKGCCRYCAGIAQARHHRFRRWITGQLFLSCRRLIDGLRFMDSVDSVTRPINIGNLSELTILQLASMVTELTGSRLRIVHRPPPPDDPRQRRRDISEANKVLAWATVLRCRKDSLEQSTILTVGQ